MTSVLELMNLNADLSLQTSNILVLSNENSKEWDNPLCVTERLDPCLELIDGKYMEFNGLRLIRSLEIKSFLSNVMLNWEKRRNDLWIIAVSGNNSEIVLSPAVKTEMNYEPKEIFELPLPITDKIFYLNFKFETSGLKRIIIVKFFLSMKLNNFGMVDVLFKSDGIDFNENAYLFKDGKFSTHESEEVMPDHGYQLSGEKALKLNYSKDTSSRHVMFEEASKKH